MIKPSRQLLVLMLVLCFSLLMGCSRSGEKGSDNLVRLEGVFVAESKDDYIKMVSMKTNHGKVDTYAIVFHQLPMIDFKIGLQTAIHISYSGGSLEREDGSDFFYVGSEIPGQMETNNHYVSGIDFVIESSNRLKYMVRTWKSGNRYNDRSGENPPVNMVTGYLVKMDSKGILSFFKNEVESLNRRNIDFTLGAVGEGIYVHGEKKELDESYCQSHFLNNCSELVKLGLLASPAGSLRQTPQSAPSGSPLANPPSGGNQSPYQGIIPEKRRKNPSGLTAPRHLSIRDQNVIIDPPGSPHEKPYPYIKIEKEIDVKTIVNNATVQCEDEEDCSENAALLIGSDRTSVFQCSATYVGGGYFTSNAHCVPTNLTYGSMSFNSNCSGSLWVKLPKTSVSEAVTHECEELSMVTLMDGNNSPKESRDMMIFKVKGQVDRKPLKINWDNQPGDSDIVTFWPSDPDRSQPGLHGVIRKKTCEISDKRELAEVLEYYSQNYPISYLKNCNLDIIKGNSGSTALNESHQGTLIISHTNGRGTGRGVGSNYICSYKELRNGKLIDKSTASCRWVSDELKNLLMGQMEEDQEEKERGEILSFYETLFQVQDDFLNNKSRQDKIYNDFFSNSFYTLAQDNLSDEEIKNLRKYLKNFSNMGYHTYYVKSLEFMEFTTSNGKKHQILPFHLQRRTGFKLEYVALPSCYGPLSEETLEAHRSDSAWNPFDPVAYRPIKFSFPLVMVRQARWENSPGTLRWDELDQLHLEFKDNRKIPVSTVFEIELSDFYDSGKKQIKNPTVTITEIHPTDSTQSDSKRLDDFWFRDRVREKLKSLDFCQ